jgi:hypothetical protein
VGIKAIWREEALNDEYEKISSKIDKGMTKIGEDGEFMCRGFSHILWSKIIVWNVRGVNDLSKQREVRNLVRRLKVSLAYLHYWN